jgi:hypothetical protein
LLLHGAGDLLGVLVHFTHGGNNGLHGLDRTIGRALDRVDLLLDVIGRLGGLVGERLHLARNHGKATARLARARRLDGGVEREQIGLRGKVLNEAHHVADTLCRGRQAFDLEVGGAGVLGDLVDDAARGGNARADIADGNGQLLSGRRYGLHIRGRLVRSRGHGGDALVRVGSHVRQHPCGSSMVRALLAKAPRMPAIEPRN